MFIRQILGIVRNSKKTFSLLHLVGLRPRVYCTLTNFRGGGKSPWAAYPPPLNTPMKLVVHATVYISVRLVLYKFCSKKSSY